MSRLFPTDEERELLEQEKELKILSRELKREAVFYARRLSLSLAEMGIDHLLRKESRPGFAEAVITGKRSRQKIKFLEARYNQYAIYLRLDTSQLPYGITLANIRENDILETLSAACYRQVAFKSFPDIDPENGTWLIVYREGAAAAIPKNFSFGDAIKNVPKTASMLRYCAGIAENMALIQPDIAKMPHLLIAGSTGMGKSVHLNAILTQLLYRNPPERVQFLMIDLKGGMELQDYRDIPHLFNGKIITEIEDVEPALQAFKNEMVRRQRLFAGKCRDLIGWNQLNAKNKLPYIILVIDELAQILRNPNQTLSNEVEIILGSVLSVSRATGGHAILCTQRPSVDVVTGYIKTNIDARVAFAVPTQADSRVILDSGDAADLTLPGRAVFLHGAKRIEMQTPYISPVLIRRMIKKVCERTAPPDLIEPLSIHEILEYSLDNLGGSLSDVPIREAFSERATSAAIREMLQSIDDQVLEVRDQLYIVKNGSGPKSRRIYPIADEDFIEAQPV